VDKVQRDKLLGNCMAPETITLKKGAQVMLIKNVDESLVNGSIGRVIGFMDEGEFDKYCINEEAYSQAQDGTLVTQDGADPLSKEERARRRIQDNLTTTRKFPLVRFSIADGSTRDLLCQPESWKVELPNGEVQASRSQVPLILAWALSIHKAQGQTLERVKVDLGKVFEKGQAYVALSRATSMAGLQVLRFDPKKVNAHDKVRTFYANLARVELQEKTTGKSEKKRIGTKAEDYEKMFVNDDLDDFV
jgi:ATP-dependent DNA helicase PIF1